MITEDYNSDTRTDEHASEITYRIVISPRSDDYDSHGRRLLESAHQLGYGDVNAISSRQLFFLQGSLSVLDAERVGRLLLADPTTEQISVRLWREADGAEGNRRDGSAAEVEVTYLPGVTDPPADSLVRAARMMGIAGLQRAATGRRYIVHGRLEPEVLAGLAGDVLANGVVQRWVINRQIRPPFTKAATGGAIVETVRLREASHEDLQAISRERRLSLDLQEMLAIQTYYKAEAREPSDLELETLAQTWSEHCVHKTFKARISYQGPPRDNARGPSKKQVIDGLLDTYIRAATEQIARPWVRSAFVDNAGLIAFDEAYDLAFKVETHNHPSALEPFGGANTGIGGVVRDILGVSARPIANTDVLCFGPANLSPEALPEGVLHPRRIAGGVVAGIEDYGNKMGIPTVNGAILYNEGYTANPLVYCGCLGILPQGSHPADAQPGDLIVAIGGRTGRDGLRGATFSSMEMDVSTGEIAGSAVQIGNPIQEKQVQEVIMRARDEQLYSAITDCGAGGFSSAVGEMGQKSGARVQLQAAPLKYPGLQPWEIWLSEAQERMVLAVPPRKWQRLQEIAESQDVEAICLGEFEESGRLRVYFGDEVVGDLAMAFLHDGVPQRLMPAAWEAPQIEPVEEAPPSAVSVQDVLLALLAHPDIRSKENVIRQYDHEVQGGTAVKPLTGAADHGPADAAVIVPLESQERGSKRAVALGNGICPQYGVLDPYRMAWAAIDEALRNVVAVGVDPQTVAILDNFCWGNPTLPDRLGALVRCAQGCYDAAVAYQTPFVSGKDSLYNEYTGADGEKHAIPGTLLISAVGLVADVRKTVTMDLKRSGNFLYLVGETRGELGGSHFGDAGGHVRPQHNAAPQPVPDALIRFQALHEAIAAGLVHACHDCSEGGLAVAAAEMCLAGRIGAEIELMHVPRDPFNAYAADDAILFSESLSRFIVEVSPRHAPAFKEKMAGIPHACVGVTGGERLRVTGHLNRGESLIDLPVTALEEAWRGHLPTFSAEGRSGVESKETHETDYVAALAVKNSPKVMILHANGTNRDRDAALACRLAGGGPEIVHVNQLLAQDKDLLDYHMLVIPGGFSYGDDLGAGVLWAADLQFLFGDVVKRFVDDGRPVLGICNGFQALVKSGLLPGPPFSGKTMNGAEPLRTVTLTHNERARFECRWVHLLPTRGCQSLFIRGLEEPIYCPVAHGEGRIAAGTPEIAGALFDAGLVALTYGSLGGENVEYPSNPNGSEQAIAALSNAAGNVLGLMPHPENHVFSWQHPRWRRGESGLDGLRLFKNGIKHA